MSGSEAASLTNGTEDSVRGGGEADFYGLLQSSLQKILRRMENTLEVTKGGRDLSCWPPARSDPANSMVAYRNGVGWLLYDLTGDPKLGTWARNVTQLVTQGEGWTSPTIDTFWTYYYSAALAFEMVGGDHWPARVRAGLEVIWPRLWLSRAGVLLSTSGGRYADDILCIDCLACLDALWWLVVREGDEELGEALTRHLDTTRHLLIREDFSTCQAAVYSRREESLLEPRTLQGFDVRSCWSRGQAWAIKGYALAYAATGKPEYRETLCRLWEYFAAHAQDGGVPYYDFLDPEIPYAPVDTSSSVIACAGMLRACRRDPALNAQYRDSIRRFLVPLLKHYLTPVAEDDRRLPGYLTGGCAGKFADRGEYQGFGIGKGDFERSWSGCQYGEVNYSLIYLTECLYLELKSGTSLLDMRLL
ncbi:MAG: glycoside hydrolase family 88 protein [Armatimonadetes bacterium]|nr:glycoside hydrolase family 88 protein [Armatimonadota bacterium]